MCSGSTHQSLSDGHRSSNVVLTKSFHFDIAGVPQHKASKGDSEDRIWDRALTLEGQGEYSCRLRHISDAHFMSFDVRQPSTSPIACRISGALLVATVDPHS